MFSIRSNLLGCENNSSNQQTDGQKLAQQGRYPSEIIWATNASHPRALVMSQKAKTQ
jgi:hypothetical protein